MISEVHFWSLNSYTELIHGICDKDCVHVCMYMYVCKLETDSSITEATFSTEKVMNNSAVKTIQ